MGNKTEKSAVGKLMKVKNCIFNVNTLWLLWILFEGSFLNCLFEALQCFQRKRFPVLMYLILGDIYFS